MNRNEPLPSIFADSNICMLDGYALRTMRVPPRKFGSAWRSTELSAMTTRTLSLRLDGASHNFEEARNAVKYISSSNRAIDLECCKPPRTVSVRRILTRRELTLLLIDELLDKPVAVIGETLAWCLDGLDVRFVTDRDDEIARI